MEDNTKYIINSSTRKIFNSSLLSIVTTMGEKILFPFLISFYAGSQGFVLFYLASFMPLVANVIGESLGVTVSILYSKSLGENDITTGKSKVYQLNTVLVLLSVILILTCVCITFILDGSRVNIDEDMFHTSMLYIRVMCIMLFFMIFLDYFNYLLRCTSNPKFASYLTITKNVLNCISLVLLLIILDGDIMAIPWSGVITYFIVLSVQVIYFMRNGNQLGICFELPKIETIKEIWQYTGKIIVDKVTQASLDAYVNISILVVFTIDIVNVLYLQKTVASVFLTLPKAITFAMVPILSVYYNRHNNKANTYIINKFLRISLILGFVVASIVLIFRYPIVENVFNFEYPDVLNIAIYAVCILAIYFPIRFINHVILNILMCLKLNRISIPIVSMEIFVLPVLFFSISTVTKNETLLWWVLPLSEIITLFTLFTVSFFYRRRYNVDSWFFINKFKTEYKNSFYILIDTKRMEDVELYQEMSVMFLNNNGINHDEAIRVHQIVGEIVEYAVILHQKKSSLIDIGIHIDDKDNILINANIDNDDNSYKYNETFFVYDIYDVPNEDLSINMYMLNKLSSKIECRRILSFTSLLIEIETK